MLTEDQRIAITSMLTAVENAAFKCGAHQTSDSADYTPLYNKLVSDRAELLSYLDELTKQTAKEARAKALEDASWFMWDNK